MWDSRAWDGQRRLIARAFLGALRNAHGCGPFDGGCLIVAQAFQSVIGGDLCVLVDEADEAMHAVVLKEATLWDWDGPHEPPVFLERYNRLVVEEKYLCVGHRPIAGWDLSEAMENDALARHLASMIGYVLPARLKTGDGQIKSIQWPSIDDVVQSPGFVDLRM